MCLRPQPRWRLTRLDKFFENSKRASAMCAWNMRASIDDRPRRTTEGEELGSIRRAVPFSAPPGHPPLRQAKRSHGYHHPLSWEGDQVSSRPT